MKVSINKPQISIICASDCQPCSSPGAHKLVTEVLRCTTNTFLANLTKKIGIIWIHSQQEAVVLFFFFNLTI